MEEGLVPKPSYIVGTNGVFLSQAFGEMPAGDALPGEYFHPGLGSWVRLAKEFRDTLGLPEAESAMRRRFTAEFSAALSEFNTTTYRLVDSFETNGSPIDRGLRVRTDAAWGHFLGGIFGLCVADPSSARSIARKEILQEAITELTNNGERADYPSETAERVSSLLEEYASCSMPFSPPEYPRSSRKRFVEDLQLEMSAL